MNLTQDTLSIILSYLPKESLSNLIPLMAADMTAISKDYMFWKRRVEILIGKELNDRDINWKSAFLKLNQLLLDFDFDYQKCRAF
jgi:hypothetical protein